MEQNNRLSELLKNTIGQRYDAIALKMIADETEIPENAVDSILHCVRRLRFQDVKAKPFSS